MTGVVVVVWVTRDTLTNMATKLAIPSEGERPSSLSRGRSLHRLTRRVAAGADFVRAARRMDFARMMICWGDLRA